MLIEGAHYGDDGEAELQIIGDGKGSVKFVDTSNDSDRANVWINVQGKLSVSNVVNFYATGDTGSALRIDDDAEANIAISGDFRNLFTGALSERLDNKKLVFELNEGSLNLRIF